MENIELTDKDKLVLDQIQEKIDKKYDEVRQGLIDEKSFDEKLEPIANELKELRAKADSKQLEIAIEKLSEDFAAMKERASAKPIDSNEFQEALKDAVEELKKKGNYQGFVKVEKPLLVKTAGNMTIAGNVSGYIPVPDREAGITTQLRRMFTIRNRSNVFPTNANNVEWVEQRNRDGAATVVAEGGSKPQIDWDYIVNRAPVENIAAWVKISKQMLNDVPGMQGEINGELMYQIELAEETQFLTGNGTSPNLKGIDSYAQGLDLTALQYSVQYANYADCIAAAITQVKTNSLMNFYPTFILMNPADVFIMLHNVKATTKEYINPVTLSINPLSPIPNAFVMGVPIIETVSVSSGTFYVCDGTKFNVRDLETLTIELGYVNDDFTKNFITIRGEKRVATYIKTQHVEGFVKSTFAAAKTFLDKSGS